MRNWFWILMLSDGKLRWPRWFSRLLFIFLLGALAAGVIYAYIVFNAVSERNNNHHVSTHRSH